MCETRDLYVFSGDSIFISVCLMYKRYFRAKYFWKNKEDFSVILSKTMFYKKHIDLFI
ncbi:hypothetical protein WCP94_000993 [Bilophila wadsworthia]